MREDTGTVLSRRHAGDAIVVLKISTELARGIAPGEFLNVKIPTVGEDPFLRRPFSVSWVEPEAGVVELLIQVRGRGTAVLGNLPEGTELSLLGPLGRGFPLEAVRAGSGVDLVAGACGAAPLILLAQTLARRPPATGGRSDSVGFNFYLGARTQSLVPEPAVLRERFPGIEFATDDGSLGFHGDVLRLFAERFEAGRVVCGCGPVGLLEALRRMAVAQGFSCYLSLEAGMACGYGVCQGCVVRSHTGSYVTVCRDGPVFEARELGPLNATH